MTFKIETGNDAILKALARAKNHLTGTAESLRQAVDLIGEYELWRIIRADVEEAVDDAQCLEQRISGLIEFIHAEVTGAARYGRRTESMLIDYEQEHVPSQLNGQANGI